MTDHATKDRALQGMVDVCRLVQRSHQCSPCQFSRRNRLKVTHLMWERVDAFNEICRGSVSLVSRLANLHFCQRRKSAAVLLSFIAIKMTTAIKVVISDNPNMKTFDDCIEWNKQHLWKKVLRAKKLAQSWGKRKGIQDSNFTSIARLKQSCFIVCLKCRDSLWSAWSRKKQL